MSILQVEVTQDFEGEDYTSDPIDGGESVSVRIANPDAENGVNDEEPGPLSWMNSARVTTDPEDDAVHCVISVGDPRGGFCMTLRRLPNGRVVLHLPHPGEGLPHVETRMLSRGTLELGSWRTRFSGVRKHSAEHCEHADADYMGSIFTGGDWYDVCTSRKGGPMVERYCCMRRSSEPSDYISTDVYHILKNTIHDDEPDSIYTLTRELFETSTVSDKWVPMDRSDQIEG